MNSIPQPPTACKQATVTNLPPSLALMLERADNLYRDGYRVAMQSASVVAIYPMPSRPGRYAPPHLIDLARWTCNCESFTGPKCYRTRDGRRTCKHLAGVFTLAADCEQFHRNFYEGVKIDLLMRADPYTRRGLHMGATLEATFGKSDVANTADHSRSTADALAAMLNTYRPRTGRRQSAGRIAA
jgi:hypothetical protein